MRHAVAHALIGVGLFKAGAAVTRRRRAGWLALAAVECYSAHRHHHRAG